MGASDSKPAAKPVQVTELENGDILLLRQAVRVDGHAAMNVNIARTIFSATSGRYFSAELHHMQQFSHVAMVLEHRHKLYVAFMSTGGLELLPGRRWFKRLMKSGTEVYVRKLRLSRAERIQANEVLLRVLKVAARGVTWQEQEAAASARGADISGRAGEDTSRTQSAAVFAGRSDLPPFAQVLMGKVLTRVAAALQEVPPQARLELTRAFNRADADRSGYIEPGEIKDMLADLKGSSVSTAEAAALQRLIDVDQDGRISLTELIDGISKIPLTRVPLEHDVEGIVSAEFVAVVLEMAGLLPPRRTHVVNYTTALPAAADIPDGAEAMSTMHGMRLLGGEAPSASRRKSASVAPAPEQPAAGGPGDAAPAPAAPAPAPQPAAEAGGEAGAPRSRIKFAEAPSRQPSEGRASRVQANRRVLQRGATKGRIEITTGAAAAASATQHANKGYTTERQGGKAGGTSGFGLALRTYASELEEELSGNIVVIHSGKAPTHHYAPVSFAASAEPPVKLERGVLAPEQPLLLRWTDVDD